MRNLEDRKESEERDYCEGYEKEENDREREFLMQKEGRRRKMRFHLITHISFGTTERGMYIYVSDSPHSVSLSDPLISEISSL
jgi:hypothetical protein